jgi:hypothetical protein
MMENNYIFLLTLTGLSFQYEWLRTGSRKALLIGSCAFGLNLLTRITTGIDLVSGGVFLLLALWFEGGRGGELWGKFRSYIAVAAPVYVFFGLLDRLYQYYRFGSFFNTYTSIVAIEMKQRDPSLPASYPWETPFHTGFFGALFSAEKSVFLFDPLLVLMVVLCVVGWRRFSPAVKAYVGMGFFLLLAYISFYARYTVWSGDFAWGDRYVSTSVEFAALLAVPLLLRHREVLGEAVWSFGVLICAIGGVVQVASLMFWLPLEIYQMETLGHPTFVIVQRMKNIVGFATGTMMDNFAMHWDPWDYVHITTWNFLPFLLKRVGVAPRWVVHIAMMLWVAGLGLLIATLSQLRRVVAAERSA